ncbi:GntR family transcriptional regulator [Piscinibacter sp. HJYY11]|uniref:GntR family transcriptional regulator n=1 Tax=Piscinibacter sp. HJYY11 TaxID=2801333 RepID=UPI00191CEEEE|nr:GntR family transcriptional regulator [Piscinibacter sp. HJYY11]MBL0730886.1 GntR family transcriptional regulator [Piscinibacter sp. HJYY11]
MPSNPLTTSPGTAAASPRLRESALYEQVAERLRARILAHTLAPGSWIDEQALANEFGISRTPLREALKVLAAEGLVTMKLRRGAYVTEVSERDLSEVYHLLALLESDAAATVAQSATDAQLAELQALHDQLERCVDDRDAFFRANEQFHLKLLHIADNRWTQEMVGDLRRVMKLNRHQSLFKQGRIEASLDEHRKIMQAIAVRDAAKVKRLMELHIRHGREAAALS